MKNPLIEWFAGRDEEASRSYDFAESHPVWKTWWFWTGGAAACVTFIWFFRPA